MSGARTHAFILALLGIDVTVYLSRGHGSQALDAAAWFILITAFSLAAFAPAFAQRWRHALALVRGAAGLAVLWAALHFVAESEWLDTVNAWLWIGVVVALEIELRVDRSRKLLRVCTLLLYAALLLVALLWLAAGDWFDAYDALLWICAFAVVERGLGQAAQPIHNAGDSSQ
ncbi:MAG: hypothetical protein ACK59Y_12145 [Betaproteobacteria bacterium]|jgi:hypothetical protein|nr:hypothetical protein [Betaproteobacteria bacterium]